MKAEHKISLKTTAAILAGIMTVFLVMLVVLPGLNNLLAVKTEEQNKAPVLQPVFPDKPEPVPVTVYYIMEENSKKISELYIEVFCGDEGTVTYMEIPTDTKTDLSEELYKSLQTYGPELPQHLKLANMAESFSAEYGLTAANRILSELVGVSLTEYIRTPKEEFDAWLDLQRGEKAQTGFFEAYSQWISGTVSSRTPNERWMYYENRKQTAIVVTEQAPGSREKDGYRISSKRTRERLEEMRKGTGAVTIPQE